MKEWVEDMDKRIKSAIDVAWNRNVVKAGSPVVVVTGWRAGSGFTNTVRVIYVPGTNKDASGMHVLGAKFQLDPDE